MIGEGVGYYINSVHVIRYDWLNKDYKFENKGICSVLLLCN